MSVKRVKCPHCGEKHLKSDFFCGKTGKPLKSNRSHLLLGLLLGGIILVIAITYFVSTDKIDFFSTSETKSDNTSTAPPDKKEKDQKPDRIPTVVPETKIEDKTPPEGNVTEIKQEYKVGEDISFIIKAKDETELKNVALKIKGTQFKKSWDADGLNEVIKDHFASLNLIPGSYTYVLTIIDAAGNRSSEPKGQFIVIEPDTTPPTGLIEGLNNKYTVGDQIVFNIKASDNKNLKAIDFQVKSTSIKETWPVTGLHQKRSKEIDTRNLPPGEYIYLFTITDASDNQSPEYTGSFLLMPKPDNVSPSVTVQNIKKRYQQGEKIRLIIKANDNQMLEKLDFQVPSRSFQKSSILVGQSQTEEIQISTHGWRPKVYEYKIIVTDQAGNRTEKKGTFHIIADADKKPPEIALKDIRTNYSTGEAINFQAIAKDNQSLKSMTFKVLGTSINKTWHLKGRTADKSFSFKTDTLNAGEYAYTLSAKDRSNNISRIEKGRFTLGSTDFINAELYRSIKADMDQYKKLKKANASPDRISPVLSSAIKNLNKIINFYEKLPGLNAENRQKYQRALTLLGKLEKELKENQEKE